MALNLLHLETFRHLLEVKSFTKTAVKLNMTQPGVSQHIKALEEYFGEKLLVTKGKVLVTTPKGEDVYRYAVKLFLEHEKFREVLKGDEPKSGSCRLASPGAIGIGLYSQLLKINEANPRLAIQFYYSPNRTIETDLQEERLDLGFMSLPPKLETLEAFTFAQERLLIVTPRKKAPKSFEELLELGFISHPDGPDMVSSVFAKNFKKQFKGFESLKLRGANNQIGRILEPVALGLGFTVIPHHAFEAFGDKKNLSLFSHPHEIINQIYVVKKKFRELPARFEFLLKELNKARK